MRLRIAATRSQIILRRSSLRIVSRRANMLSVLKIMGLLVLAVVNTPAEVSPHTIGDTGVVHVKIVDSAGNDIGRTEVCQFTPIEDPKNNLANRFRNNVGTGIPFGVYQLRARAVGFWSAERHVQVFESDVWV